LFAGGDRLITDSHQFSPPKSAGAAYPQIR
jgi:hypothetical protein